jgi:hypothetical protein
LGHEYGAFWRSSGSVGLLDLPVWLHPLDIGNFAGNRRIGLGDREFEAVPFSERPPRVPLYYLPGGTVLYVLALDQGLEDPGADMKLSGGET